LTYNSGSQTVANWYVPQPVTQRKAKNVLFFIGDGQFLPPFCAFKMLTLDNTPGMTQNMISAARLIAHKSINGKYQSLMQLDQMDNLGQ
jgi:alkaline phosphatase